MILKILLIIYFVLFFISILLWLCVIKWKIEDYLLWRDIEKHEKRMNEQERK